MCDTVLFLAGSMYYLSMDGMAENMILASPAYLTSNGDIEFTDGIIGQAVYIPHNSSIQLKDVAETCPMDPGLCDSGYTMSAWLKLPQYPSNVVMLQMGYQPGVVGTHWRLRDIKLSVKSQRQGDDQVHKTTIHFYPRESWFHLLVSFDATLTATVYINGTLHDNFSNTLIDKEEFSQTRNMLTIGGFEDTYIWVDELYIWDRQLQDSQLASIFATLSN